MSFRKLYLGFIAIVSVAIAGIIYNVIAMRKNEQRITEVMNEVYPYISQLKELQQLVRESKSLTTSWVYLKYADTDKQALKQLHKETYPNLRTQIRDSYHKPHLQNNKDSIERVFQQFDKLIVVQQSIMQLLPSIAAYEDPIALFEGEELLEMALIPQTQELIHILEGLIANNQKKAYRNKEEVLESIEEFGYVELVIALTITLLIIFSFIYIRNEITNPVIRMKHSVEELSLGRLPKIKEVEEETVIGDMSRALLKLSKSFENTVSFATTLGHGDYTAHYSKLSDGDLLGDALIQMRDALAEYSQKMEAKVAQRTQELEKANASLIVSEEELKQNAEELSLINQNLQTSNDKLAHTLDELRQTQMQLVQAEKMSSLGQLTAGVAHEINNPLNFVYAGIHSLKPLIDDSQQLLRNYAMLSAAMPPQELTEKLQELEQQKEEVVFDELEEDINGLIQDIIVGAERTQNIVNGLKTFSRMGGEGQVLVDLHENLNATLVILDSQIHEGLEVVKEFDPNLPNILCNIGQINQVFMNVLTNAIQATEKGQITLKTQLINDKAPHVEVSVSDTGKGIPPQILDKIFDPFFTTKDIGKGTGLGLSISHGIIQEHGGNIKVDSKVGKGTTFRICLPIRTVKEEKAEA